MEPIPPELQASATDARDVEVQRIAPLPTESALELLFAEIARARLAAIEAYERASGRLLQSFADEVLGRELAMAPSDVREIARRLIARFGDEQPVELVVSAADVDGFDAPIPVRADPSLSHGDVVVAVRDGTVDARFSVRVAHALRAPGVAC